MKKEKNIRAILIDPFARKVSEVNLGKSIQDMYKVLGCDLITITTLQLENGKYPTDMILDDEGLLKDRETQRYFKFGLFSQPFAGRALLTCTDKEGETISVWKHLTAEKISEKINWFNPSDDELDATLEWKVLPI